MNKPIFVFITALLCTISVKSQVELSSNPLVAIKQKAIADAVYWIYEKFPDFDRECFLIGTLDDEMGHYQTFTANKSIQDINDDVEWMFEKDAKFMPDTMACQRITTYKDASSIVGREDLAMFIVLLFKKDYPDLRALRVCSPDPFRRHYGSEMKSSSGYDLEDTVCRKHFEVELFSSSLAKTVADYYNFDYGKASLRVLSMGGDIGYRGVINKEKIQTEAQKMSFLAGVFIHYGCEKNENGCYSIPIPNSLSTAKVCADILREFDCSYVDYIDKMPKWLTGHQIVFSPSIKSMEIKQLTDGRHGLGRELLNGVVSF
jgi:hypothetical protein